MEEKRSFYDELKCEWDMHSAVDLLMCLGIFNGLIGRHIDGFDGVHGGFGVGLRNLVGGLLLEVCLKKELCVSITWFIREEKKEVDIQNG